MLWSVAHNICSLFVCFWIELSRPSPLLGILKPSDHGSSCLQGSYQTSLKTLYTLQWSATQSHSTVRIQSQWLLLHLGHILLTRSPWQVPACQSKTFARLWITRGALRILPFPVARERFWEKSPKYYFCLLVEQVRNFSQNFSRETAFALLSVWRCSQVIPSPPLERHKGSHD